MLLAHGGYAPVRASFAEDVSLARHLARRGARVGFLDGRLLYDVRSYDSAGADVARVGAQHRPQGCDVAHAAGAGRPFLVLVQGLPLPIVCAALLTQGSATLRLLLPLNAGAAGGPLAADTSRWRRATRERGVAFWLNPLADPVAVVRVIVSSLRRPRQWRTRAYPVAPSVT